jgi:signal peptidase II
MIYLITLSTLALFLDQLTKAIILSGLRLGESVSVIDGFFDLTLVENSAAAFNLFHQIPFFIRRPFLAIVTLLSAGLIVYYYRTQKAGDLATRSALALILGGALGNLVDRVSRGAVIDFLDFGYGAWRWPAFNFADSCICVGVGIIILVSSRYQESGPVSETKNPSQGG